MDRKQHWEQVYAIKAPDAFNRFQAKEVHRTPAGSSQQFVYCYCRKGSS
jgi:hypothetical protein